MKGFKYVVIVMVLMMVLASCSEDSYESVKTESNKKDKDVEKDIESEEVSDQKARNDDGVEMEADVDDGQSEEVEEIEEEAVEDENAEAEENSEEADGDSEVEEDSEDNTETDSEVTQGNTGDIDPVDFADMEELVLVSDDAYTLYLYRLSGQTYLDVFTYEANKIISRIEYSDMDEKIYFDELETKNLDILELTIPGIDRIIFLQGHPIASSPGYTMCFYVKDEEVIELFGEEGDILEVVDINGDQSDELVVRTHYGGQTFTDIGFQTVYSIQDQTYLPSIKLTQMYEFKKLALLQEAVDENATIDNVNVLLEKLAYLGDYDACQALMEEHKDMVDEFFEGKDTNEDIFFEYRYFSWEIMANEYKQRWIDISEDLAL